MKRGMSIESLLETVKQQRDAKRDFVASTKESLQMVVAPDVKGGVALVLLREGASELERFEITENCHRQIAGRLQINWKYYNRLLEDHKDMVIYNVNQLFEREPQTRLLRTLDGKARAFLSDRYRTIDNDEVLEQVLPPLVTGDIDTTLLSSNVGENKMYLKVLFNDDNLAQEIGKTANGTPDIVRPGIVISNSETGMGSMDLDGFFYRDFCLNGCVFGKRDIFNFNRRHVGGKLKTAGDGFEVFSDETKRKQNELIVAEMADAMTALTNPENVQKMGDTLREAANTAAVKSPFAAVDTLAKEITNIREADKESILENLMTDRDYTKWGMLNAVTKIANSDDVDYERACELEDIGAQILSMNLRQWNRIAEAERVAA